MTQSCFFASVGKRGREVREKSRRNNLRFIYLSQQRPGIFTKMWTDGCQKQSLCLYKMEDQVSVHSLNRQLTILIFGCLQKHKDGDKGQHQSMSCVNTLRILSV